MDRGDYVCVDITMSVHKQNTVSRLCATRIARVLGADKNPVRSQRSHVERKKCACVLYGNRWTRRTINGCSVRRNFAKRCDYIIISCVKNSFWPIAVGPLVFRTIYYLGSPGEQWKGMGWGLKSFWSCTAVNFARKRYRKCLYCWNRNTQYVDSWQYKKNRLFIEISNTVQKTYLYINSCCCAVNTTTKGSIVYQSICNITLL